MAQERSETATSTGEDSKLARPVVLVLGLTGAGKTTFINQVTNSNLAVGNDMKACTSTSEAAIGTFDGVEVAFVDTPGFDDPKRSDATILIDITDWIANNLGGTIKVTAALFLHSISTRKMHGSAFRNFKMFSRLVGSESMSNVALVTTFWDVVSKDQAVDREIQLCADPWKLMLANHARIYRLDNDLDTARKMIVDVLNAQPSFIKIQKPLSRTEVGEGTLNELRDRIAAKEEEVDDLEQYLAKGSCTNSLQEEEFRKASEQARSELKAYRRDCRIIEKVPTWGDLCWDFTKTQGPQLVVSAAVQYYSHSSETTAGAAAARELSELKASLAAAEGSVHYPSLFSGAGASLLGLWVGTFF